jgi:oligopeptide/dipeptide ABC transporter ATP-binding protein
MSAEVVLQVRDLRSFFMLGQRSVRAVDGVSFEIRRGEMFGLAGESGCGKTVTALSIMRLLDRTAKIVGGEVLLEGENLVALPEARMRALRGDRLAMIFQDPMTSLNPVLSVGQQIAESIVTHRKVSWAEAGREAKKLIALVGIDHPERRFDAYPHQLSGGMRQRIMIALAVALRPVLLIADEPTTALDVTVQQQILVLLKQLCAELGMAVLLITHNLGVVAETCERVAVMYAGQLVEMADTVTLFRNPLHPYTQALLRSMPMQHISRGRLAAIPGRPPILLQSLEGCHFAARCSRVIQRCWIEPQALEELEPGHWVRCGVAREALAGDLMTA